jgi:hypothetical protein
MSSDDSSRETSAGRQRSRSSDRLRVRGWIRGLRGRSSPAVVVAIGLLVCSSTLVGAANIAATPIPTPEPGAERTYNDTFRVLASNDVDPGRGSNTVQLYEYDNGTIREVNRTVVTQPVQLWDDNIRPRDALVIADESDMYQTGLSGQVTIPYRDRWDTLAEWNTRWGDRELRIIPIYGADPSRATNTDGEYTVEARNPNGWWDPVYNAEVEQVGNELTVTNPDAALVHTAEYQTVIQRKQDIVESLLRYSELAPSEAAARSTSVVPMDNGSEVFPTVDGASMAFAWRSGSHALVRDAYIGFIDVTPGIWYRGRYVTQNWQVNTHVPWDYRIQVPSDYSESGSCTVNHRHPILNSTTGAPTGNFTTHTHTYPLTRWAEYRLLGSNATVVNVTAGNISMQQWGPGAWTTLDYNSPLSSPRPLPVGVHTMTAELQIDVALERSYGIASARCSEWNQTETVTRSMTITRSVPSETVNSDALAVDVHVYDRPGDDIVSVNWAGQQGLAAGAAGWEYVEVQVGEKRMYVTAPWRFFSVARNSHVEERHSNGMTEVEASHSIGGRYPALLRYRMSPATVEVLADQPADQHVWWETTHVVENGSVPATALPATIVAPENTEPSPLYNQYAGLLKSTDTATGESVSARSVDIWGVSIDTSARVTRYEQPELTVRVDDAAGTAVLSLVDGRGDPIRGRVIDLEGANVSSVRTDSSGNATVAFTSTIVRARFSGDDWRKVQSSYYLPTQALGVSNTAIVVDAIEVVGHLTDAISNVMIFVEWLVLGLFAMFWMRSMRRRPA